MKKLYLALLGVGSLGLLAVHSAHAQIATSTAGTLIDDTITSGGTLLSVTLLKIFGFAMALAIIIFVFWFVISRIRHPR